MVGLATGVPGALTAYRTLCVETAWQEIGWLYARWTDDTQMTLDLASSLLAEGDVCQNALASLFASLSLESRIWPRNRKVLKQIRRGASWQTASRAVYQRVRTAMGRQWGLCLHYFPE